MSDFAQQDMEPTPEYIRQLIRRIHEGERIVTELETLATRWDTEGFKTAALAINDILEGRA